MEAVDDPSPLSPMLIPSYVLEYAVLDPSMLLPYGKTQLSVSPYATWFARVGKFWSTCPWYIKICVSLLIIVLS